MFNDNQLKQLQSDLDSNRIKSREKGNINLSYLEGFDIIDTANKIFGYGNWSYNVSSINHVSSEQNQKQNHIICYKAVVEIIVHNESHTLKVSREDVGFGTGIAKTLADAHEGGAKESITDAIKRCLRSFGNQFGNSLYNKSNSNNTKPYNSQTPNQAQNQQPVNNNHQYHNNQQQANTQNYTPIYNLGLSIQKQNEYLIVNGDSDTIFANKALIKNHGFKWDAQNKVWWKYVERAA